MTADTAAAMFADAPESACLFVSDSIRFTRAAIHHALKTDTETQFVLTEALTETIAAEWITARKLQQLLDDGTATISQLDADDVETAAIYADEIRIATPSLADYTETPFVRIQGERGNDLTTAYENRVAASTSVETRFADTGWTAILDAAADSFDTELRDALATATDTVTETPRSTRELAGLLCLVAAGQECTQNALAQFTERYGLASRGTVTKTASRLEEAGVITRASIPVDRQGRPPKRLKLADETLAPTAYVDHLVE